MKINELWVMFYLFIYCIWFYLLYLLDFYEIHHNLWRHYYYNCYYNINYILILKNWNLFFSPKKCYCFCLLYCVISSVVKIYWPFFGFSESGKQILKRPTSRLKYLTSSSKSLCEATGSLSSMYVRFTRISYQLSVPNAIAKQATATTAVIVANDKVTAEQAIGNFAPRKQNFFKRKVCKNKFHR